MLSRRLTRNQPDKCRQKLSAAESSSSGGAEWADGVRSARTKPKSNSLLAGNGSTIDLSRGDEEMVYPGGLVSSRVRGGCTKVSD